MRYRVEYLLFPAAVSLFFVLLYYLQPEKPKLQPASTLPSGVHYYEFQKPYLKYTPDSTNYELLVVADKDKKSKNEELKQWESILKRGVLKRNEKGNYSIDWRDDSLLTSRLAEAGRSMELSELVWFNGQLLAPDDRTGVVYSLEDGVAVPKYIVMDGNGHTPKGFKAEWATVKEGLLYLGSIGKEWTNEEGVVVHHNPQWVKTIDSNGLITHFDWKEQYSKLREAAGAEYPGYLLHEAAAWNPVFKKWFFFPRRFSTEPYDEELDEARGSNLVLIANEEFTDIQVKRIGPLNPTRGFSSIAFIPSRENELVYLKSEEYKETVASYLGVVDVESGKILMEEQQIGNVKFEGVEIM